jgi:hypothetical protein
MRAPREDKIFYASLIRLTEKAHRHASSRLEDLQKKLLGMLIEKEAQITNVASHVGGNGPDYKYVVNDKRVHKSRYKKSKLKTTLTESKTMLELGIHRIYDCGKTKYELKNPSI